MQRGRGRSARGWAWSATAMVALGALGLTPSLGACSGTAVFDAVDPEACGSGHGCPTAACICNDGSAVLDTTCALGACRDTAEVCDEKCDALGGVESFSESTSDEVALLHCEQVCARIEINGCELGCETLFSECLAPSSCSDAAKAYWTCVAESAVITCRDNAVQIEGCDNAALAFCEP